jgi:serine/threonine protein kinase/tetratricopeptide (TPR) repeat protein
MTPERWQEVSEELDKVLRLEAAARSAYLLELAAKDSELHGEVKSLLASHEEAKGEFLRPPAAQVLTEPAAPSSFKLLGRRVGVYQVVEEIGVGGMGQVFRAFRADDQYRKQVALKVVSAGSESGFIVSRFKNERQILASLDHPNIARLLDGGTIDDVPYFVMELIEGESIDLYCEHHKLIVADRLKLFLQVCSAVQFAHQRLIIHRDLKPGNILVTADGAPKLLDFGIAKILDDPATPADSQPTLTMFRMLTPGYASPEQIKGDPITTASDVYSLGVVLYELLTGCSPYRVTDRNPQELARAVCEAEPEKPSAAVLRRTNRAHSSPTALGGPPMSDLAADRLSRRLRGDLDNIVLMALRKEPQRRYASVEQFATDIRRHLEDLPVVARTDTFGYRTSKFIARHKAGVLAAASVAFILIVALIVTIREARIARRQAAFAQEQRARAERRFNDVRKLANSLIFDIHDSIENLPGSTKARRLIADRAVEYLDSLNQESNGDPGLQRELAAAYDRVGEVLGFEGAANLGDHAGAVQIFGKALAIRESLLASHPTDQTAQRELAGGYWRMMFALKDVGDFDRALEISQRALPLMNQIVVGENDSKMQQQQAGLYWLTGVVLLSKHDGAGALRNCQQAAEIRERISGDSQAVALAQRYLVADHICIGQALALVGRLDDAIPILARATATNEQLVRASPRNATLRGYLAECYDVWADVLLRKGDLPGAWNLYRRELSIWEDLSSRDPSDRLAAADVAFSELSLGQILLRQGRILEGLRRARSALLIAKRGNSQDLWTATLLSMCYSDMGNAYVALADRSNPGADKIRNLREARSRYGKAQDIWIAIPNHGNPDALGHDQATLITQEITRCDTALTSALSASRPAPSRR